MKFDQMHRLTFRLEEELYEKLADAA